MHPIVAALLAAMHAHTQAPTGPRISPDAHLANAVGAHLSHAAALATDPELKMHLANAHAALAKHAATLAREHQQAMGGKMIARQMARG